MLCVRVYEVQDAYGDRLGLGVELVKPEVVSLTAREDLAEIDMPDWRKDPSYFWGKGKRSLTISKSQNQDAFPIKVK